MSMMNVTVDTTRLVPAVGLSSPERAELIAKLREIGSEFGVTFGTVSIGFGTATIATWVAEVGWGVSEESADREAAAWLREKFGMPPAEPNWNSSPGWGSEVIRRYYPELAGACGL